MDPRLLPGYRLRPAPRAHPDDEETPREETRGEETQRAPSRYVGTRLEDGSRVHVVTVPGPRPFLPELGVEVPGLVPLIAAERLTGPEPSTEGVALVYLDPPPHSVDDLEDALGELPAPAVTEIVGQVAATLDALTDLDLTHSALRRDHLLLSASGAVALSELAVTPADPELDPEVVHAGRLTRLAADLLGPPTQVGDKVAALGLDPVDRERRDLESAVAALVADPPRTTAAVVAALEAVCPARELTIPATWARLDTGLAARLRALASPAQGGPAESASGVQAPPAHDPFGLGVPDRRDRMAQRLRSVLDWVGAGPQRYLPVMVLALLCAFVVTLLLAGDKGTPVATAGSATAASATSSSATATFVTSTSATSASGAPATATSSSAMSSAPMSSGPRASTPRSSASGEDSPSPTSNPSAAVASPIADRTGPLTSPVVVARTLARLRATTWGDLDAAAARRLNAPRSPALRADLDGIASARSKGVRYSGLSITVRSAQGRAVGESIVLEALLDTSAFAITGPGGASTRVEARRGQQVRFELAWSGTRWQIAELS